MFISRRQKSPLECIDDRRTTYIDTHSNIQIYGQPRTCRKCVENFLICIYHTWNVHVLVSSGARAQTDLPFKSMLTGWFEASASSFRIMFEYFSFCGWQDLLSTFKKSENTTCLDDFGFSTCTKVNRKSEQRLGYHGSRLCLLWQNSPHKDAFAFNHMTNMHRCIVLCKF